MVFMVVLLYLVSSYRSLVGGGDLVDDLLDGQHLTEESETRARGGLQLLRRNGAEIEGRRSVTQEEDAKVARCCLARGRIAAHVRGDTADDDAIDIVRAENVRWSSILTPLWPIITGVCS